MFSLLVFWWCAETDPEVRHVEGGPTMARGLFGAVLIGILAFGNGLHAVESVEPVVVTASKLPRTPGNVTQKVDTVDSEQLSVIVSGHGNVADWLLYQPGIFASPLSRNDANWGSVEGLSQKYNTYMLEGLPIDVFVEPQSLEVLAFDRIEVQRGPAAVLYPNYLGMDFAGNQSPLTGTTNILLKERFDKRRTFLDASYGSYNTLTIRFLHQQPVGDVHFFLGGGLEDSDYTDYGTEDSWLNMIDDPEYQKTKLYGKMTWFVSGDERHKVSVFAHHTNHHGDAGRPKRGFDHDYWTLNSAYQLPLSQAMTASFKVGYRNYDRTWQEDNYPTSLALREEDGVRQEIVPGDFSLALEHWGGSLLTIGADFQTASYKTYADPGVRSVTNDADALQYGVYAQEEFVWGRTILRLGGRYAYTRHEVDLLSGAEPEDDSASWDEWLWSAGVRHHVFGNLAVYANVGTSFVAPSIHSVGGTLKASDRGVPGKDGRLPNPDLEPESGMGGDLGFDWKPYEELGFGARGFYNKVKDNIVQVVVSENPSQSQDINAGDTTSYGVELEVHYRPLDRLRVFANYTYTDTSIENDEDPDVDGAEVPFVPKHMGNIGADMDLPYDIKVGVYLHVAGRIYDSTSKQSRNRFPGYEVLNAYVEKLLVAKDTTILSVYGRFYNLTDNRFEMPWQFQDPGFAFTSGIKFVF
jgi:outer membrane receptor protein involved in Fe transport